MIFDLNDGGRLFVLKTICWQMLSKFSGKLLASGLPWQRYVIKNPSFLYRKDNDSRLRSDID